MTFAHPALLAIAVLGLATLAFCYRAAERRRAAQAHLYSNLAFALDAMQPSRWPAIVLTSSFLVGAFAVLVALAGPHFTARIPTKDGTVVLCIDTSGSMRARDVEPSRSEAASEAARAFIDSVPSGTHIGIVSFSSSADVVVAPTSDLDAARDGLDRIPPPEGGTAIGDALTLASRQMPATGRRIIVLLTDGVNNLGRDPIEAAREAASHGITIETVGVGSSGSGQIIPGTGELADLDAQTLRTIAETAGGQYAQAADAETLRDAFRHIALGTVWQPKRVDGSFAFAFAGGAMLMLAFIGGLASGRFP